MTILAVLAGVGQVLRQPLLLGPLAATGVLVLIIPDQSFAQPRNIVAGYLLAVGVAIICRQWLPATSLVVVLAVGLTLLLLLAADALHPPGIAILLLLLAPDRQPTGHLVLPLLLGVGLIIGLGWLLNKLVLRQPYPARWC